MTTPPALLIAGHGARDDGAAEALRALVRAVGERHPEVPVAGGFFGAPGSPVPLADAVDALAGQGVTELVAVPLLLAPTGTGTETLPAALERAAAGHPGLRPVCAAAPGPDPRLLDVLERRLEEALGAGARTPQDRARTTVLLVGRGASDPHANAEVARAARLLWEGRGFAGVETAFVGQTAPDVPAGLDRCRALAGPAPGAAGPARVVVLPYAFFADGPVERLWMQTEGWAAAHPDIEVFGAQVLGTGPEVAEVVMERYRAAVAGGALPAGDRAADDGDPYGPQRVAAGAGER
ncbi:sirohydrochlorin chelatase [Streptomyces sp. NRRL S-1448]|uniref:sirohydrochlorin chelatase n=1 Tax=Streptomyces sp. NRRL S-1448 TaxID=1463883 RepID=UPI0004BEFEEF|nr:sirohydrochlorin chelatase [Streptomyces sp. NRRL S-1448]